jgi:hypothetical protein
MITSRSDFGEQHGALALATTAVSFLLVDVHWFDGVAV